ncbi:MAG TPA: response regulator transcription factor [Gallionellaceae bacterium]
MFNTLIVDDSDAFRQSLHQILARSFPSMNIVEAADGEAAFLCLRTCRPDLVFMDIRMPGANGLDITKAIKSVLADTRVCVITSYDLQEYRDAALSCGADHFIVKDKLTTTEIAAIVDDILSHRQD